MPESPTARVGATDETRQHAGEHPKRAGGTGYACRCAKPGRRSSFIVRRTIYVGVFVAVVCGFPCCVTPLLGSPGNDPSPEPGCQVTVLHDHTRSLVRLDGGTVGDALTTLGIAVDEDDIVTPALLTIVEGDIGGQQEDRR
jgi:hypothetical protein